MALIKRGMKNPDPASAAEAETTAGGSARMPVAAPKRRTGALALSLSLAVIGGLLMWAFQQSSAATPYLTVNRSVDRGTVIDQGMLSTVDVVGEPAHLIPAADFRQVLGKVVTADLGEGSPVTDQNTADSLGVEQGKTVVGVALGAGRLPARELKAGDQVQVIFTPNTDMGQDVQSQAPIAAVVEGTGRDEASGNYLVDLNVPESNASAVAAWAARDAVSVILGSSAAPAPQEKPRTQPAPAPSASPSESPAPSESKSPEAAPAPSQSASGDQQGGDQ